MKRVNPAAYRELNLSPTIDKKLYNTSWFNRLWMNHWMRLITQSNNRTAIGWSLILMCRIVCLRVLCVGRCINSAVYGCLLDMLCRCFGHLSETFRCEHEGLSSFRARQPGLGRSQLCTVCTSWLPIADQRGHSRGPCRSRNLSSRLRWRNCSWVKIGVQGEGLHTSSVARTTFVSVIPNACCWH